MVDSLALHSSYSSVRLESFLFTEQAFRDIKAKLKPGGVFAMYNFYRQGWVVGRLVKLAETVFGSKPIVSRCPIKTSFRQTTISATTSRSCLSATGHRRSSTRFGRSSPPRDSSGSILSLGSTRA